MLLWRGVLDAARMAVGFKRKRWRDAQRVRVDLNGMMGDLIGEGGLADAEVAALGPRLAEVHEALLRQRRAGTLGFADLPYERRELRRIVRLADAVRGEIEDLVVLGIGSAALGTRALCTALPAAGGSGHVRVHVADTIDPEAFGSLLARLDLRRTLFNVISKSGDTPETMSQFLIVRDRLLKELGAVEYARHVVITTDAASGALRQIVNDEGFRSLAMPADVGGRFAVLSSVALFPAACAGIDVAEVLAGAADMAERCWDPSVDANPAFRHAGALFLAGEAHGARIVVIMPYAERLAMLADWFCQLWAESLGKARGESEARVHVGQTPVKAVGPSHQHTQLQLWVDGPRDKALVFIRVEDHGAEVVVPTSYEDLEQVGYLGGHGLGELVNLEQQATELALARAGRPTSTLVCPGINAFVLGQLLYLFEMEAVIIGGLLGVNPFDQPGLEDGKQLTYGLAGRPGYEGRRADVQRWLARKEGRRVL